MLTLVHSEATAPVVVNTLRLNDDISISVTLCLHVIFFMMLIDL